MKSDPLEDFFGELDFDIAEPAEGHEDRFRQKLEGQKKKKIKHSGVISFWLPALCVAASLVLAVLVFGGLVNQPFSEQQQLANVSHEMEQTQEFYSSILRKELENLKEKRTPATEKIIDDALMHLQVLEAEYQRLQEDLGHSGQDQRVIYAMISNFQQRIDLLKNVLDKIETVNKLKSTSHENGII